MALHRARPPRVSKRVASALAVALAGAVAAGAIVVSEVAADSEARPPTASVADSVQPTDAPPTPGAGTTSTRTTPDRRTRSGAGKQSALAAQVEALTASGKVGTKRRDTSRPKQLRLATPTSGRSGTGLVLGALDAVTAPVGGATDGPVTVSVANIPNRTSSRGYARSIASITADGQDFLMLNEVSGRDLSTFDTVAPGYGVYRDPVVDRSRGGTQSMNNAVAWRSDRWNLVDAGRVKVVDDDRGYRLGKAFVWDRYVTWAVLQRIEDGAVVSVMSTHMPTNPVRYPAQPGGGQSRLDRYSQGMDRVVGIARTLNRFGPVLLGGDMNSHPPQGRWTAAQKMTAAGYAYTKDRAVMHLFFPQAAQVLATREVAIDSDHPALVTTLDLDGAGPS